MTFDKNLYAVIMAGGKGERFWPQSRQANPKPLLKLVGDLTLIEQTVDRLKLLIPTENIIIITNKDYISPMISLLPQLPASNVIGEPVGKDTAPCIALATSIIQARNTSKDATMIVLPADHVIKDTQYFVSTLKDCIVQARKNKIVTIGIEPGFPSTGYGYIHCGEQISENCETKFFKSLGFKEKPDLKTATRFIEEKCYKWNSGIFIWTIGTISAAFKKYTPSIANAIEKISQAITKNEFSKNLDEIYPSFEKVSIDYAIMEKTENVVVAEFASYWDDVGSWTALRNQIHPSENNNIIRGLVLPLDTENSIIVSDSNHLIATVDLKDVIVVHTDDVTLVCNAKSAQKIKELVHKLSTNKELAKFT